MIPAFLIMLATAAVIAWVVGRAVVREARRDMGERRDGVRGFEVGKG